MHIYLHNDVCNGLKKKTPQKTQNAVVHDKDWPQWSWRRGPHHPGSSGPRMHAAAFSDHKSCSEILHSSVGQENIRASAFHNFFIVKWPHSGLVMLRYVTECTECEIISLHKFELTRKEKKKPFSREACWKGRGWKCTQKVSNRLRKILWRRNAITLVKKKPQWN